MAEKSHTSGQKGDFPPLEEPNSRRKGRWEPPGMTTKGGSLIRGGKGKKDSSRTNTQRGKRAPYLLQGGKEGETSYSFMGIGGRGGEGQILHRGGYLFRPGDEEFPPKRREGERGELSMVKRRAKSLRGKKKKSTRCFS